MVGDTVKFGLGGEVHGDFPVVGEVRSSYAGHCPGFGAGSDNS